MKSFIRAWAVAKVDCNWSLLHFFESHVHSSGGRCSVVYDDQLKKIPLTASEKANRI